MVFPYRRSNAALWGLLCAILRFIPYLGPILGAAFPLAISLAVFEGWAQPFLTLGLFLVVEIVSNNFVEPWLYSSSTGLSKTAIVVSAIFWAWLWGGTGLLLATPLTVCLAVLGKYIPQLAFLDVLLGSRFAMAPSDQFYQRLLAFRDEEAGKVARDFLKMHPFVELCDDVIIPALVQVKTAWHEEVLDERHFEFACDTVDEIVADLGSGSQPDWDSSNAPCSVLFLPASDAADETIAHMVTSILQVDGFRCETVSSHAPGRRDRLQHCGLPRRTNLHFSGASFGTTPCALPCEAIDGGDSGCAGARWNLGSIRGSRQTSGGGRIIDCGDRCAKRRCGDQAAASRAAASRGGRNRAGFNGSRRKWLERGTDEGGSHDRLDRRDGDSARS